MLFKKLITILFTTALIISHLNLIANNPDGKKTKQKKQKKIPENIEVFKHTFSIRPFYSNQLTIFSLEDKKNQGKTIFYRPNAMGSVGAEIGYKQFKFSYAYKLPVSDNSIKKYGNTEYKSINFGFQGRVVGLNFYYFNFKSFYLHNPSQFYPEWTKDNPYPHRKDLSTFTFGFFSYFCFNKSFSINSAFSQNERQKKSAGSFMLLVADRFTHIENNGSLIPLSEYSYYGNMNLFSTGSFNSTIIAPGIGYNIIVKRLYFSPILLVGSGPQIQSYNVGSKSRMRVKLPLYFNYKNAIGYNGKTFYTRVVYSIDINNIPLKDAKLKISFFTLIASAGFRF